LGGSILSSQGLDDLVKSLHQSGIRLANIGGDSFSLSSGDTETDMLSGFLIVDPMIVPRLATEDRPVAIRMDCSALVQKAGGTPDEDDFRAIVGMNPAPKGCFHRKHPGEYTEDVCHDLDCSGVHWNANPVGFIRKMQELLPLSALASDCANARMHA
jgi:hypothetical protein